MNTEAAIAAEVIREALYYLSHWQNKTLLIGFASIGSVQIDDVEMLAEDIRLLCGLGVKISIALSPGNSQFLKIFNGLGCGCFKIGSGEDLASKAVEFGATKLCLLSGVDRINTSLHGNLDDLSVSQAEEVANEPDLSTDARRVLQLAISACRNGVPRVHIVNAHHQGKLLEELFTCRGAGMMVYSETALYKEVRRAQMRDTTTIVRLLCGKREVVNAAYRSFVSSSLDEFVVFAIDDEVYGCARLITTPDGLLVNDVASGKRYKSSDILQFILEYVIKEAVEIRAVAVIVPVQALPALMGIMPWFSRLGFVKSKPQGGSERRWVKTLV
jgi:N-acetylglutamate synthase-like GNAT family acetyltransferase